MAADHALPADVGTVHWGFFRPDLKPVLRIRSGDSVRVQTLSGSPEVLESAGVPVTAAQRAIFGTLRPDGGPHILTGPIHIAGVEAGDLIAVEFLEIGAAVDWAWTRVRPGKGVLDWLGAPVVEVAHIDRRAGIVRYPSGISVPLAPFLGIVGVAPSDEAGRCGSGPPGPHGGNLDIKSLTAGSTLYLPAFQPGGLVSVGDGHAAQGDGEIAGTAAETALDVTLRLSKAEGAGLLPLMAETRDDWIVIGLGATLDDALKNATSRTVAWLRKRFSTRLSDAIVAAGVLADFRISQAVNGTCGVHAMIPRAALPSAH